MAESVYKIEFRNMLKRIHVKRIDFVLIKNKMSLIDFRKVLKFCHTCVACVMLKCTTEIETEFGSKLRGFHYAVVYICPIRCYTWFDIS